MIFQTSVVNSQSFLTFFFALTGKFEDKTGPDRFWSKEARYFSSFFIKLCTSRQSLPNCSPRLRIYQYFETRNWPYIYRYESDGSGVSRGLLKTMSPLLSSFLPASPLRFKKQTSARRMFVYPDTLPDEITLWNRTDNNESPLPPLLEYSMIFNSSFHTGESTFVSAAGRHTRLRCRHMRSSGGLKCFL